jgi:hypothetical protein
LQQPLTCINQVPTYKKQPSFYGTLNDNENMFYLFCKGYLAKITFQQTFAILFAVENNIMRKEHLKELLP